MASEKRCHYEVLGLSRDCTAEEIRSAYKKLALQRHPDKLVQSGFSQAEATARFQELAHAYEVLSDPKERAWYDSHRSQILFSDPSSTTNSAVPDLFSFFSSTAFSGYSNSGRGFYKVYSDLFGKVYANEIDFARKLGLGLDSVREAPVMGNLESPYAQVTAFYNYWLGFSTVMDFCWVDQYDVMAGPNRKSRRVMEEENNKLRKKARREYNDTVRGLAEFVKKRDKRVIDMAMKKNLEMVRKKEEERERKRALERERLEKLRDYVEPEWARAEEEGNGEEGVEELHEEDEESKRREGKEFYCVVCGKKFKSEKQWKNHEQSKKHKEKVAEFRDSLADDEEGLEEDNLEEELGKVEEERLEAEEDKERVVEEMGERIRDGLEIGTEEENGAESHEVEEEDEVGAGGFADGDDDEMGVLEAMVAGHKGRKNVSSQQEVKESGSEIQVENDESDGVGFMEYDIRKGTRRNRGGRKDRSKMNGEEAEMDPTRQISRQKEESNGHDGSNLEESSAHSFAENESNGNREGDDQSARTKKASSQPVNKKGPGKKDTIAKPKNSSKQKKAKSTSKNSSNVCDTCGEEFGSRNKLHMHLGDTGHASLKHR
ncbi:hypothetical protein F2P56_003826 [Juglans regia]|uniref:DNAJ protein JJJ1 homolog n=2 Tax=Juglans regia TaxID=51240 RepID=A0A833Y707_JUGRE|nr:DNAJ protein JJJ1 homolog [Juglans regia]KAF5477154.1 hypothetical protein F2P56_003826 [Juglans regia]